jgi:hypothetical protein
MNAGQSLLSDLKRSSGADRHFRESRVEDGRGSLGPMANPPFPIPAHGNLIGGDGWRADIVKGSLLRVLGCLPRLRRRRMLDRQASEKPCMGRCLSSGRVVGALSFFTPSVGALRRRYGEPH